MSDKNSVQDFKKDFLKANLLIFRLMSREKVGIALENVNLRLECHLLNFSPPLSHLIFVPCQKINPFCAPQHLLVKC